MRKLLIIIFCITAITTQARLKDRRVGVTVSGQYCANMGASNYKTSARFVTGQMQNGAAFDILVNMPVYHNIFVGVYAGNATQNINSSAIQQQMINRYYTPDYYNTISVDHSSIEIARCGIEGAYNIHNDRFGIEPFVRIGFAMVAGYDDVHATAHLKKKNENYFEEYNLSFSNEENNTLNPAPAVGIRLSGVVSKHVSLSLGWSYTYTDILTKYTEIKTNFYNETSKLESSGRQEISTMLFFAGIQVKIGKNRNR
jgi:hypothetical protein